MKQREINGIKDKFLTTKAELIPETINMEERTVEVVATTSRAVRMFDWDIGEFYESLSMDESHVDLERYKKGAPFVDNHTWRNVSVKNQFGAILDSWIEGEKLICKLKISKRHLDILEDIADGILTNFSIGYTVTKYLDVSENDDKIKSLQAIDWSPFEISAVMVPADPDAKARSLSEKINDVQSVTRLQSEENNETINPLHNEGEKNKQEGIDMTPEEKQKMLDEAKAKAKADEMERQKTIRSEVKKLGLDEAFAETLIEDADMTLEKARSLMIDEKARVDSSVETTAQAQTVVVGQDMKEKKNDAIVNAILHKALPNQFELSKEGRDFSHLRSIQILEEVVGTRGLDQMQTIQKAFASADFGKITEAVTNKSIAKVYNSESRDFLPLVSQVDRNDYKENHMLDLSGMALKKVDESGKFEQGLLTPSGEKYVVEDYARQIDITHKTILNDDLGLILATLPNEFAQSAITSEKDAVWGIFTDSFKMSDGNELFLAGRGNLAGSGAAPDETTVNAALKALAEMKFTTKKGDKARLKNFIGKYIIGGYAQKLAIKKLVANVTPAKSSDVNAHADDDLRAIIQPRISGNAWYVAPEKPMIEFAYLLGRRAPVVRAHEQTGSLVKSFDVHHAFGVGVKDAQGLYKNPGA